MASFRSRRISSWPAYAALATILGPGSVIALAVPTTGCSRDAAASMPAAEDASALVAAVDSLVGSGGSTATAYDPRTSLAPMIERVAPQVVSVHAEGRRARPTLGMFGGGPSTGIQSHGSGFVYSADGLVVTNHHVVDGASRVVVRAHDGREFPATVLGSDPSTDLALVQIEGGSGLSAATLGNSTDARVGDWVVAIGSPMGLEHSASVGIVSAKGRGSLGLYADSYLDFLQTDADISPGSSGGPLFDLEGRVVGINTAVGPAAGAGFAIPIDQAKAIIPKLQAGGKVVRGWLGAAGNDEPGASGATVGQVYAGTPAAAAGLREGDVVTKVDGKPVRSFDDLRSRIADLEPGHTALLEVVRDGATLELGAVLAERPAAEAMGGLRRAPVAPPTPPASASAPPVAGERLGVQVTQGADGLAIARVEEGSTAERIGLQPGDVVRRINGSVIDSAADVTAAVASDAERLSVDVVREGSLVTLSMRRAP